MARETSKPEEPTVDEIMATCAMFHTRRAARAVTNHFDRHLKAAGIKATHFSLLVMVSAAQGRPLSEIANYMAMDRTALARDLRVLEELDLITIDAPENDRRTRIMALTSKGKRILQRALPAWRKAQEDVVRSLPTRWPQMLQGLQSATNLA
jgi:DNA-binding MarR family transcriptional regulator